MVKEHSIIIVSGSRADAGLLQPVINKALNHPKLDPIVLTLNREWLEVPKTRMLQVEMPKELGDKPTDICKALGYLVDRFSFYFDNIQPEMIVVLGDRWDIFAAATAAYVARIPVAHIHGGEISRGSYDQGFRDSITQMASVHFPATDGAMAHVALLGGGLIAMVGALGVDGLERKTERTSMPSYIIAYYPETVNNSIGAQKKILDNIAKAVIDFAPEPEFWLWLSPNPDVMSKNLMNFYQKEYIRRPDFLEALGNCRAIIGNSSAGIIEAPALGTPTINIGNRQEGRPMADSILQSDGSLNDLKEALAWADQFNEDQPEYELFYKGNGVAGKIVNHIVEYLDTKGD